MKLSVIIPVYNERELFPILLNRVKAVAIDKEIIVVDNCSTDGTRELVADLLHDTTECADRLQVVLQPHNYGKGMSVRTGIARARGKYLIVQDADLEYNPEDYHKLLAVAEAEDAPVVFGTRLARDSDYPIDRSAFYFARVHLTTLFRILYGARITDVSTCYKLMRTEVARSLNLKSCGFDLDFEISAKLCRKGYPIREVPISYRPRSPREGKKIRPRDGFIAVYTLLRYRFWD